MRRFFYLLVATVFLCLQGCGSSSPVASLPNPNSVPGNKLPGIMAKQLDLNRISGTFKFFDRNGTEMTSGDMQYNAITNEMTTGFVPLPIDVGYRSLVTVNYDTQSSNGLVQVAVIGLIFDVNGVMNIKWEDKDVLVSEKSLAESKDFGKLLPPGSIANLNTDGDLVVNYYEIVAGSNPKDPTSLPEGPSRLDDKDVLPVLGSAEATDQIVFEMEFEDPLGVKDIQPASPPCGYPSWIITDVPDYPDRKHLKATFNPHVVKNLLEELQIRAINDLGFEKLHTLSIKDKYEKKNGSLTPLPEIEIVKPRPNETLSGLAPVEALACDEEGVKELVPLLKKDGDPMPQDKAVDEDTQSERFEGTIDSTLLEEGAGDLWFRATRVLDETQKNTRAVNVVVDNGNPIQVSPPAGSRFADVLNLKIQVAKSAMPEVAFITIESVSSDKYPGFEDPEFDNLTPGDDNNNDPDLFEQNFNVSFVPNERTITLQIKAESKNHEVLTRVVSYTINNDPDILDFSFKNSENDFNPCLAGGEAELHWYVQNWESTKEKLNNAMMLNGVALKVDGQFVKEGTQSITCGKSSSYALTANRLGIGDVNQADPIYSSQASFKEALFSIEGLHSGMGLSPEAAPYEVKLIAPAGFVIPTGLKWQVTLQRENAEPDEAAIVLPAASLNAAIQIDVAALLKDGWDDGQGNITKLLKHTGYIASVQLINSQGFPITWSENYKIAIKDEGMTGWFRFAERVEGGCGSTNFWGIEEGVSALNASKYVCDWANGDKPGQRMLNLRNSGWTWLPGIDGLEDALDFGSKTGAYGSISSNQTLAHGSQDQGLTVEALVNVKFPIDSEYIVSLNGEYGLGMILDMGKMVYHGILGTNKICGGSPGFWGQEDNILDFVHVKTETQAQLGWHHLVMVYDPNNNNDKQLKMFIDGIQDNKSGKTTFPLNTACGFDFTINALLSHKENNDDDVNLYTHVNDNGPQLAEIAIYKKALSSDEVKASCLNLLPDDPNKMKHCGVMK